MLNVQSLSICYNSLLDKHHILPQNNVKDGQIFILCTQEQRKSDNTLADNTVSSVTSDKCDLLKLVKCD